MLNILRAITTLLLQFDIFLHAQHVPGITNIAADYLSRFQAQPKTLIEHGLHPQMTCPDYQLLHSALHPEHY